MGYEQSWGHSWPGLHLFYISNFEYESYKIKHKIIYLLYFFILSHMHIIAQRDGCFENFSNRKTTQ